VYDEGVDSFIRDEDLPHPTDDTSMLQPDRFKEEVADRLQCIAGIYCVRTFRHWGLYDRGHFIGIIAEGKLYLRTNAITRQRYVDLGMVPYHESDRTLRRFYQVPTHVVRDTRVLVEWTRDASAVRNTISQGPFV